MPTRFSLRQMAGALALVFLIGAPAMAQNAVQEISPEHLALARRYVDLTDGVRIFELSVLAVAVDSTRTLISQNADLAEPVSQAAIALRDEYFTRKDDLFNQFARIYAIHFTPEELQQIVTFYETDVGRRLTEQNAAINQELTLALEVYRNNLSTEFMLQLRRRLAEQGYQF